MKIQGAKKVHYDSGPNMTPLVDVVMVILIFLMLTGSFGGVTHFLFAKMPISKHGINGPKGIDKDPTANITVNVRHTGMDPTVKAYVGNGVYSIPDPADPEQKALEATGLEQALNAERDKLLQSGAASKDNIQVIIAPLGDVQQRIVIKVYEAAYEQGFTKIGFKLPQ